MSESKEPLLLKYVQEKYPFHWTFIMTDQMLMATDVKQAFKAGIAAGRKIQNEIDAEIAEEQTLPFCDPASDMRDNIVEAIKQAGSDL